MNHSADKTQTAQKAADKTPAVDLQLPADTVLTCGGQEQTGEEFPCEELGPCEVVRDPVVPNLRYSDVFDTVM